MRQTLSLPTGAQKSSQGSPEDPGWKNRNTSTAVSSIDNKDAKGPLLRLYRNQFIHAHSWGARGTRKVSPEQEGSMTPQWAGVAAPTLYGPVSFCSPGGGSAQCSDAGTEARLVPSCAVSALPAPAPSPSGPPVSADTLGLSQLQASAGTGPAAWDTLPGTRSLPFPGRLLLLQVSAETSRPQRAPSSLTHPNALVVCDGILLAASSAGLSCPPRRSAPRGAGPPAPFVLCPQTEHGARQVPVRWANALDAPGRGQMPAFAEGCSDLTAQGEVLKQRVPNRYPWRHPRGTHASPQLPRQGHCSFHFMTDGSETEHDLSWEVDNRGLVTTVTTVAEGY
nr:uncharacterized protein LOC105872286 isoform X2 [Microcebus murinus]